MNMSKIGNERVVATAALALIVYTAALALAGSVISEIQANSQPEWAQAPSGDVPRSGRAGIA